MKQMNVLLITKHDPWGVGGGCYATCSYLKALSVISSGHIDVCVAESVRRNTYPNISIHHIYKVKKRNIKDKVFSVFTGETHRYTHFVRKMLRENLDKYTHCVFDHSSISGSLVKYVSGLGIKTITIHHNYEPEYFVDNTPNFIVRNLFYHHVVRAEKTAYINSDYNLFLTKSDYSRFDREYGQTRAKNAVVGCFEVEKNLYNGYDETIKLKSGNPIVIVISGSLVSYQTENGLIDFFTNLYPVVATERYRIIITGKRPSARIKKECEQALNIELIPNPQDIQDVVRRGDIYLCPTKIGGGLKLRIMDGLKNGLCVITHDISSRGYDCFFNKPFFQIYSDKATFEKALKNTIKELENGQYDRTDIRRMYYENFSFESGVDRIKKILDLK